MISNIKFRTVKNIQRCTVTNYLTLTLKLSSPAPPPKKKLCVQIVASRFLDKTLKFQSKICSNNSKISLENSPI